MKSVQNMNNSSTSAVLGTLLSRRSRLLGLAVAMAVMLPVSAFAQNGPAPVNLGTAGNFAILAETAITNIPITAITGDVGISPNGSTSITGLVLIDQGTYATSTQVTGRVYGADMDAPTPAYLGTAIGDMVTAYTDAAGRTDPDFVELNSGNIGGSVLTPGLYKWSGAVTAPSDFVLDGGPDDVWIFQIAGDLSLASNVNATLSGGAQAQNIFWQVTAATLGTNSHFEGIILSGTAISLQTGASLNGRALAQSAVTLDMNMVTEPTPAPPGGCELTITGTVEPDSIAQGRVQFDLLITNNADTAQQTELWMTATGPTPYTKYFDEGTIPANTSVRRRPSFHVSGHAPTGTYTVTFYVGDFTNSTPCDQVEFVIVKLPVARLSGTDNGTALFEAGSASELPAGDLFGASATTTSSAVSPNPFAGRTQISYAVETASQVRLSVYDVLGREVAVLVDAQVEAGAHSATFDARGLSAGTYVYRLVTGSTVQTGRMTLTH